MNYQRLSNKFQIASVIVFRIEYDQEVQHNIFQTKRYCWFSLNDFAIFYWRINDPHTSLRLSIKEANLLSFEIILGHIEDADISYMKDALNQKTQGSLVFDLHARLHNYERSWHRNLRFPSQWFSLRFTHDAFCRMLIKHSSFKNCRS